MHRQETLQELADEVARSLVGVVHGQNLVIIRTPLLYPSGATVLVHIQRVGDSFVVSDMGDAYGEADMIGATSIYVRNAKPIAQRAGISFEAHAMLVLQAARDQLVGAVMTVANCAKEAMEITTLRLADQRRADAGERLHLRLVDVFGHDRVARDAEIIGSSNHRWHVAALVRMDGHRTVFEPVSQHHNSIFAAVAKFHDLALIDDAPTRVAVVRDKSKFGNDLNLLIQAGKVVNDDIPAKTLRKLAEAA